MSARKPARLLTTAEAAALLGIKPRALEVMRNRGGGPAYTMVGRFPRYSHASITAYLASRARLTRV